MATRPGPRELRDRLLRQGRGGTTTLSSRLRESRAEAASTMFGDLEDATRLHMELLARASVSPDAVLPDVIALLVPGDAARRAAIVAAIRSSDPLREQWERTWEVLRR